MGRNVNFKKKLYLYEESQFKDIVSLSLLFSFIKDIAHDRIFFLFLRQAFSIFFLILLLKFRLEGVFLLILFSPFLVLIQHLFTPILFKVTLSLFLSLIIHSPLSFIYLVLSLFLNYLLREYTQSFYFFFLFSSQFF